MATQPDPTAARRRFWRWLQSWWATFDVLIDREARADLKAADLGKPVPIESLLDEDDFAVIREEQASSAAQGRGVRALVTAYWPHRDTLHGRHMLRRIFRELRRG